MQVVRRLLKSTYYGLTPTCVHFRYPRSLSNGTAVKMNVEVKETKSVKDYNPFEHRKVEKPTS